MVVRPVRPSADEMQSVEPRSSPSTQTSPSSMIEGEQGRIAPKQHDGFVRCARIAAAPAPAPTKTRRTRCSRSRQAPRLAEAPPGSHHRSEGQRGEARQTAPSPQTPRGSPRTATRQGTSSVHRGTRFGSNPARRTLAPRADVERRLAHRSKQRVRPTRRFSTCSPSPAVKQPHAVLRRWVLLGLLCVWAFACQESSAPFVFEARIVDGQNGNPAEGTDATTLRIAIQEGELPAAEYEFPVTDGDFDALLEFAAFSRPTRVRVEFQGATTQAPERLPRHSYLPPAAASCES